MARPAKSTASPSLTLATMINFFVTGSLAEVRAAVETGKAILASRSGTATNGAGAPAPRKRDRKPKQPALPGTTAATAAPAATGPVAVPGNGAAKRGPGRPRGPRAARPAVTGADAAPAVAGVGDVPGAVVEAAAGAAPLPDQGVPGEE